MRSSSHESECSSVIAIITDVLRAMYHPLVLVKSHVSLHRFTLYRTGFVPDPAQSTAKAQVEKVGQKISRIYRDGAGEGLSSETLHGTTSETSVYTGPTDGEASQNTAQRSHRSL